MIQKFCIRKTNDTSDDRCSQCLCRLYRKRVCSVFKALKREWPTLVENLRDENERLVENNDRLRGELVLANRLLFRMDCSARVN